AKDEKTLEKYGDRYPQLRPLAACLRTRNALSRFSVEEVRDGKSHFFANNYGTVTGRDAPTSLFTLPGWARFLIKPPEGWGVAYLDFSAEEIVIAAALSKDQTMLDDYYKDIYVQQAIKQGLAPLWATKETHPGIRDQSKPLVLGINYGRTKFGLAPALGIDTDEAEARIAAYMRASPDLARGRRSIGNGARRHDRYFTRLGWPFWITGAGAGREADRGHSVRAMMNHPIQATGADLKQLVMIVATEA